MHEFIHALGFHHEQTRPDRDEFVDIIWENIPEEYRGNFEIFYGSYTYGVAYDGQSVVFWDVEMAYFKCASQAVGKIQIQIQRKYSPIDPTHAHLAKKSARKSLRGKGGWSYSQL